MSFPFGQIIGVFDYQYTEFTTLSTRYRLQLNDLHMWYIFGPRYADKKFWGIWESLRLSEKLFNFIKGPLLYVYLWVTTVENLPSDMCGLRRFICAFARSDQNLHWPHFGLPRMQTTKRPSLRKHAYSNILKILPSKNKSFQIKISDIFHISAQNIVCGYSLEPPRRGGSNEYPQSVCLSRNKKNNVYPCKPQFY